MVLGVTRRLGVDPTKAVMVGDSGHDIDAGQAAGCPTVLVTNGRAGGAAAERADYVIADMSELVAALGLS